MDADAADPGVVAQDADGLPVRKANRAGNVKVTTVFVGRHGDYDAGGESLRIAGRHAVESGRFGGGGIVSP